MHPPDGARLLWQHPSPETTALRRFGERVAAQHGVSVDSYDGLHRWSVAQTGAFWRQIWHFCGVRASVGPGERIVDESAAMFPRPAWFPGVRLNYAENILYPVPAVGDPGRQTAIVFGTELGVAERLTWSVLRARVAVMSAAMRGAGIAAGDRVAGILGNTPNAVVALLATACIGALWSCASPDFGTAGIVDRLAQVEPKLLLVDEAVFYNGKVHDTMEKAKVVAASLPTLEKVVCFPSPFGSTQPGVEFDAVSQEDFLSPYQGLGEPDLLFTQLPFDHPLYILFSSGTTGLPKCIVHSGAAVLLQHKKEHMLHCDVSQERRDLVFQYTTSAWMMWPWLLGVLACGVGIVLYDGSPFKPQPLSLWKLCEAEGVTVFGTSAKYIASLEQENVIPTSTYSLSKLRLICSTGSVLPPSSFEFLARVFNGIWIGSITGGTDICSLFGAPCPLKPLYSGEIQCKALGMAVEVYDLEGNNIEHTGEPGDLVCTKVFPCMPVKFWGVDGMENYRKSYFDVYPGVWHHGDYLQVTKSGGLIMLGRSDSILNPAGVRFGSSEIYNVLSSHFPTQIEDSLCLGLQKPGDADERVLLFVKMKSEITLSPELKKSIASAIRRDLSPRHVPYDVVECPGIPYTVNGKKIEIAVKNLLNGRPVKTSNTVANPESFQFFQNWMAANAAM